MQRISSISSCFQLLFQSQRQVAHVLLTRSPLVYPRRGLTVRLACVKHAASVRPDPGSNSPLKNIAKPDPKARQTASKTTSSTTDKTQKLGPSTINLSKESDPTSPNPPQKADQNQPGTGSIVHIGIDFKHAVKFSRLAHTPHQNFHPGLGRPAEHYSNPDSNSTRAPGPFPPGVTVTPGSGSFRGTNV